MKMFRYILKGSFYSHELGMFETLEDALAQFENLKDVSEVYNGLVGWTNENQSNATQLVASGTDQTIYTLISN